jgi:tetratricopeptide (TPR) repeat protein
MHARTLVALTSSILLATASCAGTSSGREIASSPAPEGTAKSSPRLFGNLGKWRRDVTTKSPEAQRWFDQALSLTFGFNHDEAIRSYQEAARLDPLCAMAWWGIAYCNGPHINNPALPEDRAIAAWEALEKAVAAAPGTSPVEQALIGALAKRYSPDPKADRAPLDQAYADAMRAVWKAYPQDADVGTLCAEALMDLHPWDLWTHEGQPKEYTPEIVETLEKVLAMAPDQPGANHFYIHTVEASARPERAVPAADRLRTLVPGAGHLVHMPAHIYIRVGRFEDASKSNIEAMKVDAAYRALSPEQGFYRLYMAHNPHFLAFTSMMEGRYKAALEAARSMIAGIPPGFAEENASFMDPFLVIELEVYMRFGKWKEILAVPEFSELLPVSRAYRHFARGAALAATGKPDAARAELAALQSGAAALSEDRIWMNNNAKAVLAVAAKVLAGEIAAREDKVDEAVALLREAGTLEDALTYDEPPDWMQPTRHTLGAVLLRAGRSEEAEKVYREDLVRFPENGWALWGLRRALDQRGFETEAGKTRERFEKAWKRADVKLDTTCFCLPGV